MQASLCLRSFCAKSSGFRLPWQRCQTELTWVPQHTQAQVSTSRSVQARAKGDDDDDDEAPVPGKPMRVERLLANLGYGKRKECQALVQRGRATRRDGTRLKIGEKVLHSDVVLEGEELDPPFPLAVLVNKPVGYVVTAPDDDRIPDPKVYDLLPYRFGRRRPILAAVGRLDKETSGLLLLTDDGQVVHQINSPKKGIWKVYEATLASPLVGKEAEAVARKFASGGLTLKGDYTALLPAKLEMTGERTARVSICEGRYHQIRRMFGAMDNEVVSLRRVSVGALSLEGLPESEWRYATQADIDAVFSGPTTEDVMGAAAPTPAPATSPSTASAKPAKHKQPLQPAYSATEPGAEEDEEDGPSASSSRAGKQDAEGGEDEGEEEKGEGVKRVVLAPAPGQRQVVKKYRDSERWQRRRDALKKIIAMPGQGQKE